MHVGIANPRWRGKRSRHSQRMRNPQFYISCKMSMALPMMTLTTVCFWWVLFNNMGAWPTYRPLETPPNTSSNGIVSITIDMHARGLFHNISKTATTWNLFWQQETYGRLHISIIALAWIVHRGLLYTACNCKEMLHHDVTHGPLTRYVKLRVVHAPGMPGTFSPPTSNETAI